MADAHPVDRFFRWVEELPDEIYPEQLVPVAGRHVEGVAGFPAGRGLYAPCGLDHRVPPPFPYEGLMLVGNHLDAEDVYVERLQRGEANGDPCPDTPTMRFWSMLYGLLDRADIRRDRIFVTNVHPALIRGDRPTGQIKASRRWLNACEELLRRQIEVMRPSAVVAMGAPAQHFVGDTFGVRWQRVPDEVVSDVQGRQMPLVAVRHPSAAQSHERIAATAAILHRVVQRPQNILDG